VWVRRGCAGAGAVELVETSFASRDYRSDCDFLPFALRISRPALPLHMNPDTAERAVVDATSELVPPFEPPAAGLAGSWAALRSAARSLDPAQRIAVREVWRALWGSRLLVWAAGAGTVLAFGFGPARGAFDPPRVTRGFGWLGDLLAAPAARWDGAWYLVIAHYGYRPDLGAFTASRTAFFPLYPLGLSAISHLGVPPVLAGVLLSVGALALALYGIHRLTTLELEGKDADPARPHQDPTRRGEVARLAVIVTAFTPMAFYFSAVYSESLYLALSVGVFWCARKGRWAWVGVLGALAATTRSAGVVLLVPAAMLYLYGPREDRAPDFLTHARGWAGGPRVGGPRYKLRRDVLWLGLVPAGLGLYLAYLVLAGGDALLPFHAQDVWGRHFAGPYLGMWDGVRAAFEGARQLLSGQQDHLYYPITGNSAFINSEHNLLLLAFMIAAAVAIVGVLRLLPLAYGVYVIAALALPLSYPVSAQPLMSLPRFLVVLFPLGIWLAAWLAGHPRARTPVLVASGLLMAAFTAQFATWHWVA
jgi:Mannosyltransferase (PIG-V)